jgi:PQQ-dependent dehydrogenase (methanol/ethanol family)
MTRRTLRAAGLLVVAIASGVILASASGGSRSSLADVGWGGFGNTPDQNRYSPLTQITPDNVSRLQRVYTVDFRTIDPSIRRGEQSYPVVKDGVLYMTTNDGNVWALDAAKGTVKWRWVPSDVAVFRNFGIVANRGVALCDGHVFMLTLDMTIVSLDPETGRLEKRIPIAKAVPGASSNYGYSETSAPICANHRLIIGAAGSEYGVRGFVMAYHTDLTPAWPNPFWTIPPAGTSWRRGGTLVGGGVVWTPTTVDPTTNTLYFGTGSATPLYFASVRPGANPRANSLIAVDLGTGRMKWWQQQMSHNEWAYDTAQPPLVYTGRVGGKRRRVVSVGTMEGVWFCYDAATGQPIYQRVKVIDRTEHPALQPGKPVAVFPASLGGLNYSPASFHPGTNFIFNAAAETAAVMIQAKLTPTQRKRKLTLGDVFLGLENGNFGQLLPGWKDHGSISAIDVNSGRRVWKFQTPEPERGGVTTTASGLGFAGGGDGLVRAFDVKNGKVLWTFQTGSPIAAGPSIYSVNGTQYVAITSGGTPTSSQGGTQTRLFVFALPGSGNPLWVDARKTAPVRQAPHPSVAAPTAPDARAAAAAGARISTPAVLTVQPWVANSSNIRPVEGKVTLRGAPVSGARVRVGAFPVPRATGRDGTFSYDLDVTMPGRRIVRVSDVSAARVRGRALTGAERRAVLASSSGFTVAFALDDLSAKVQRNGTVLVSGRAHTTAGNGPPLVRLLTYQLSGTITDTAGKPVKDAVVITRTQDRDFWTHSAASDANGHYSSFFAASDETSADPVELAVGVALGDVSYGGNVGTNAPFARLRSATMNIQLGPGANYKVEKPQSYVGAVYSGLIVGATAGGKVVKPLSERWPDRRGNFTMTLPASVRGKTLRFWENERQFFSRFTAVPGGPVDVASWPAQLGPAVPVAVSTLKVPR